MIVPGTHSGAIAIRHTFDISDCRLLSAPLKRGTASLTEAAQRKRGILPGLTPDRKGFDALGAQRAGRDTCIWRAGAAGRLGGISSLGEGNMKRSLRRSHRLPDGARVYFCLLSNGTLGAVPEWIIQSRSNRLRRRQFRRPVGITLAKEGRSLKMGTKARLLRYAALSAVLLVWAATAAYAGKIFNIESPFAFSTIDPCTSDLINVQGTFHVHLDVTESKNGGFHAVFLSNLQNPTAFDTVTGQTCTLQEQNQFIGGVTNQTPGGATEFMTELTTRVVCPGPSNNDVIHAIFHLTIDAQGNPTAVISDFKMTCGQ